jgi:tripartite-type tricarboxylate transporter receptor subunit TctC
MNQSFQRRDVLRVAAAGAAVLCGAARAQSWPVKPVTMIVPFPAGGGTDAFARPLSGQFTKIAGQTLVIDNRGGAGGTLGASIAAKAPADGYTLFMGAVHHAIAPSVYPRLDYDIEKDFVPLMLLANVPQVVVINPKRVQANTIQEFIALVKRNPGKFNYGSAGSGTSHHLAGELFKLQTGTFITHIPYRGAAPAMADVMGGQVPCMFLDLASGLSIMQSNKVRVLAIGSGARSKLLPNVPTLAEVGVPNTEVFAFQGILGPAGLPPAVVNRLNGDLNKAFGTPAVQKRFEDFGMEAMPGSPAQFAALSRAESKRWGPIIKQAGIKLD